MRWTDVSELPYALFPWSKPKRQIHVWRRRTSTRKRVVFSSFFARLNKEINEILDKPETIETLQKMALTPMKMSSSELAAFATSEIARWRSNIKLAGIGKQ